jgi:hypothetical protein
VVHAQAVHRQIGRIAAQTILSLTADKLNLHRSIASPLPAQVNGVLSAKLLEEVRHVRVWWSEARADFGGWCESGWPFGVSQAGPCPRQSNQRGAMTAIDELRCACPMPWHWASSRCGLAAGGPGMLGQKRGCSTSWQQGQSPLSAVPMRPEERGVWLHEEDAPPRLLIRPEYSREWGGCTAEARAWWVRGCRAWAKGVSFLKPKKKTAS